MKFQKHFILTILFLVGWSFIYNCSAQLSLGGFPLSKSLNTFKSADAIPVSTFELENIKLLEQEDLEFPSPFRYSVIDKADIDLKNAGLRTSLASDQGTIWRYVIEGANVKSVQLFFDKFYIPSGATLFLYNNDYSVIYGSYTQKNVRADSSFVIADFPGDKVIIEYFEPAEIEFEGIIHLNSVGLGYKDILSGNLNVDEDGFIGVNCSEGMEKQEQKHAVCLISFTMDNLSGYLCSGSLLNNTENDGTPYFLTANHCISTNESANSVVVYFNYEQKGCNGEETTEARTLSGAELLTTGTESDFTLLLLDDEPISSYQPFYAGWDVSDSASSYSFGIHHPSGEPKKISIDNSEPVSYNGQISWENNSVTPPNSHWQVLFDEGQTAGGSSGSPLFNASNLVIGQLHGGGDDDDYYGKLSYSWHKKDVGYKTLRSYLDPDSSGIEKLQGYYPSGNLPDPQVYIPFSAVCIETPIKITGYSAFNPQTWEWNFEPNTITYHDNTDSTSSEPVISFDEAGDYNVTLKIGNTAGDNSLSEDNIASVGSELDIDIFPYSPNVDSCLCSFDSLVLKAEGSSDVLWSIPDGNTDFTIKIDSVNPVVIYKVDSVLSSDISKIPVIVEASHGQCIATIEYSFPLISQENDSVDNALILHLGQKASYSNKCATVEENEPEPEHYSCTAQDSWCDEFGTGENILGNSVWFYFIAEEDARYTLISEGIDNQIAVYKADSSSELFSGDYELLAANDDKSSFNYNAYIKEISVDARAKYFVQVDGSAGNLEGQFSLLLKQYTTSTGSIDEDQVIFFPQPAQNQICIKNLPSEEQQFEIKIFDTAGILRLSKSINDYGGEILVIDVTSLEAGYYVLQIQTGSKVISNSLVKE